MTLERFDPVRDIQTEVNRLFDGFFGRPFFGRPVTLTGALGTERLWAPVADMYETKDDLVVSLEVPGVREKDESYHRLERASGKFERTIQLPMPVQSDKVKATYRDGVLEIRLPKVEEVKPKEIKIDIL